MNGGMRARVGISACQAMAVLLEIPVRAGMTNYAESSAWTWA